jgi:hypothetical protein
MRVSSTIAFIGVAARARCVSTPIAALEFRIAKSGHIAAAVALGFRLSLASGVSMNKLSIRDEAFWLCYGLLICSIMALGIVVGLIVWFLALRSLGLME